MGELKTVVWVTAAGQAIPLPDMENDHLVNAEALARRRADRLLLKELDNVAGDPNEMYAAASAGFGRITRLYTLANAMRAEIERRGLQPSAIV